MDATMILHFDKQPMTTQAALLKGKAFRSIVLLVLATILVGQEATAGIHLDTTALHRIDTEAQRLIDEHRAPGLAVGIMSEGRIIYAKGFGLANLETGTTVTPDTVFMIGSITKQFTAAAVILLAEQGKLKIDDPISLYFPGFPRGEEVTIRQLLTHTSGIQPNPIKSAAEPSTPERAVGLRATADVVALLHSMPNLYDFEPGTSFRYSNSGYWLLGAIIEKVSGVPLGDFLKQNLFTRAGMTATALDDPTEVVPHRASGYNRSPGADLFINPRNTHLRGGAGGIRSTIGDMLRWQDALFAGHHLIGRRESNDDAGEHQKRRRTARATS